MIPDSEWDHLLLIYTREDELKKGSSVKTTTQFLAQLLIPTKSKHCNIFTTTLKMFKHC